jgi:hypothetical protein
MEALSNFESGQIVGTCLAGASAARPATLLQVYRERQFLRFCRPTRIMGRQHQRSGTVDETQHRQKEIVVY